MPIRTLAPTDPRSRAWDWLVARLKAHCPTVEVWHEWDQETTDPPPPADKSPLPPGKVGVSLGAMPEPPVPFAILPSDLAGGPNRRSFRAPVLVRIETSTPGDQHAAAGAVAGEIAAALSATTSAALQALRIEMRAAGCQGVEWVSPFMGGRDGRVYRSFATVRLTCYFDQ